MRSRGAVRMKFGVISLLSPPFHTHAHSLSPILSLTHTQADGVLSLTLRRLTGMERGALEEEAATLTAQIRSLEELLGDRSKILSVVELEAVQV